MTRFEPDSGFNIMVAHPEGRFVFYADHLAALEAAEVCPVCGGNGKTTHGGPCACNGSGKISDAYQYLRGQNLILEAAAKEKDEQGT